MKIQKCDFEITVTQLGFEGPRPFSCKQGPKIQNHQIFTITYISHVQLKDNNLLTSRKKSVQLAIKRSHSLKCEKNSKNAQKLP